MFKTWYKTAVRDIWYITCIHHVEPVGLHRTCLKRYPIPVSWYMDYFLCLKDHTQYIGWRITLVIPKVSLTTELTKNGTWVHHMRLASMKLWWWGHFGGVSVSTSNVRNSILLKRLCTIFTTYTKGPFWSCLVPSKTSRFTADGGCTPPTPHIYNPKTRALQRSLMYIIADIGI